MHDQDLDRVLLQALTILSGVPYVPRYPGCDSNRVLAFQCASAYQVALENPIHGAMAIRMRSQPLE